MYKKLILACALLWASSQAMAQQQKWTLQQCVDYATENNLQLRLSQLNVRNSQEALKLAEHARNPNLNGFATHNYNWGRSFDVFTNQPITQRVQSNNFGLNGNVVIFNDFSIRNGVKQAQTDLQASELDVEKSKNDMILLLMNAYLQILFSQENLNNANLQLQTLDAQIVRTQELVSAGVLPESNLLDLKSQRATSELQQVNNANTLAFSKLQLRQILQLPADQPFDVIIPTLAEPQVGTVATTASSIYGIAESNMPQVKSADLSVQSAEIGIDLAEANLKPTLTMNYGVNTFYSSAQKELLVGYDGVIAQEIGYAIDPATSTSYPVFTVGPDRSKPIVDKFTFLDQLDQSMRASIGFTLNVPIYNRNQAQTGIARANIARDRARLQAQIVRNTLMQDIERAYQDAVAAGQTYLSNKRQVEALTETFRVTQERYNLGVTNSTDFTVAQNNLNVAQANLVRAKYDYVFKTKLLDFYLGKPIVVE